MKKIAYIYLTVLLFLIAVPAAFAERIIKVPLGEAGPDIIFDGTTFRTADDGNALTSGDQNTRVIFSGFDVSIADILTPDASFTLSGVTSAGNADTIGPVISQTTTGGSFSLFAPDNSLLLSGTLTDGAIVGSQAPASTGSFFNTTLGTFTGGSLLSYFSAQTLDLSFALNAIVSGQTPGLAVDSGGKLAAFSADASGLIQGAAVPEPVSVLLLLSGLGGIGYMKKRTVG